MACDGKIQNREGKWKKKCVALLWDLRSWLVDKWESIDSIHKHIFLFTYILQHTHTPFFGGKCGKEVIKRVISTVGFTVCQSNKLECTRCMLYAQIHFTHILCRKNSAHKHTHIQRLRNKNTHTPRRYGTRITHRITFMKHFNAHSPSFAHSTRDPDRTK